MTPQQIVALGVRLFAVFVALQGADYLIKIPLGMANTNLAGQVWVSLVGGAICLLVATLLWFFPMVVAHRIVPRTAHDNRLRLQPFEAARAGSCLIGLWLLAASIPGMLWYVFMGVASASAGESIVGALDGDQKVRLAYFAVQLVLSFVLVFKSHLFASIAVGKGEAQDDEA